MLAELDGLLEEVEPFDLATSGEHCPRLRRANGPQDGRRGQPAAGGGDRAGGRARTLRLPGHCGTRDLPQPDRADSACSGRFRLHTATRLTHEVEFAMRSIRDGLDRL